jgi:hypothetical protein
MIRAGGFTSGREIRRVRTETEAAAYLEDLLPPAARPGFVGRHSTPAHRAVSRTQAISSTLAQRASVGSTEASASRPARVGVVGPKHLRAIMV